MWGDQCSNLKQPDHWTKENHWHLHHIPWAEGGLHPDVTENVPNPAIPILAFHCCTPMTTLLCTAPVQGEPRGARHQAGPLGEEGNRQTSSLSSFQLGFWWREHGRRLCRRHGKGCERGTGISWRRGSRSERALLGQTTPEAQGKSTRGRERRRKGPEATNGKAGRCVWLRGSGHERRVGRGPGRWAQIPFGQRLHKWVRTGGNSLLCRTGQSLRGKTLCSIARAREERSLSPEHLCPDPGTSSRPPSHGVQQHLADKHSEPTGKTTRLSN